MKWLLVLLLFLAGGLTWAALAVPTDAAVVNGTAISQQQLNTDVSAIASSPDYQCYLNAQYYLASNGSSQLPPVEGAGQGQNPGDNPTANSGFVANYLDTEISHQLVLQVAGQHGVTVGQTQRADARAALSGQITVVMQDVAQTAQGENPTYSCHHTTSPLTGDEVLGSLPSSFVDSQVQYLATASALSENLAGIGSSQADLVHYYDNHRSEFDTVCYNGALYTSASAATAARASVAAGTPFSQVAAGAPQHGALQCGPLVEVAAGLGTTVSALDHLAAGQVSDPVSDGQNYLLLELSSRTTTPYGQVKSAVSQLAQNAGSQAAQAKLTQAERRASVTVNPRYGSWKVLAAQVFPPSTPPALDVLNPPANEVTTPSSASSSPFSG